MTLREMRVAAGLTQTQLAAKAGVAQSLVSALEAGLVPSPRVGTIENLAAALDTDLATVLAALRASIEAAA